MSIWKINQAPREHPQTSLIDVPFVCRISKLMYKTPQHHKKLCKYTYCKLSDREYKTMLGRNLTMVK